MEYLYRGFYFFISLVISYNLLGRVILYYQTGSLLILPYESYGLVERERLDKKMKYCRARIVMNNSKEKFPTQNPLIRVHMYWLDKKYDLICWLLDRGIRKSAQGIWIYKDEWGSIEFIKIEEEGGGTGIKNILIVGKWSKEGMDLFDFKSPIRYGAVVLGNENCDNSKLLNESRLLFLFTTYGRCGKIESPLDEENWDIWPLGPVKGLGLGSTRGKEKHERQILLNGLMTITPGKITRMQAQIAATEECEKRKAECELNSNWKLFTGTVFPRMGQQKYKEILEASSYTLCPFGNNPEQYRIWEAILAGSIPIIEDTVITTHPKYGSHVYCDHANQHSVLKSYEAPVFYITNWQTDLPKILETADKQEKQRMKLVNWMESFEKKLIGKLVSRIRAHFW